MTIGTRRWFVVAVLGIFLALLAMSCSKSGASATRYHCPMHPTYVSDTPGDCPICGMRLVPIDKEKSSAEKKPDDTHEHRHTAAQAPSDAGALWTCPMDPEVVSDKPGRCPRCGMALEPKTEAPRAGVAGYAAIDVSAEGLALAGVRTAEAVRGRIERTIRAAGVVRADETRIRHVHTKIEGWIEKLFIDFTGQPVQKGRPILSIYSQELLASQEEYVRARDAAQRLTGAGAQAANDMLSAARRRLELFDVPASAIAQLEQTGTPQRTVTLLAPVSGIVTGKQIFEGQRVEPGMELFNVSDLSRVWIEADVYENEAPAVHVGQEAKIELPSDPAGTLTGKVRYIYPYLNADTRTLRVRFDFPNRDLKLKLDMFVNVKLPVQTDEGVIVPDSAVMDTGVRQLAFVSTQPGHFEPREVKAGIRSDGKVQILSGIAAGEQVAIKANFLLDSESRLRAAIAAPAPAEPETKGAKP